MRGMFSVIAIGLSGALVALLISAFPAKDPHRIILRPTGCEAVKQLGLKPLPHGISCELVGNFEDRSLSWVRIDGIKLAKSEVIAIEKTK